MAKSEGLRDFLGDRGKSGGAFQLYTGGGLGNEFQKKTGLNPLDPANEKATIDYALSNVGKTGWGPYHGAKRVGIGPREGIGAPPNGQTAGPGSGAGAGDTPAGDLPPRVSAVGGGDPAAFITHHTGGRGSVAGVQNTLRQRGLGVEYVMDREGNIVQTGGPGSSHMRTGWGPKGAGLSNRNTVGMEIIAKDDKDVTPQQAQAYAKFMALRYCIVFPNDSGDSLYQRDYRQPRDQLVRQLEAEGPGTLQLPTQASQLVVCPRYLGAKKGEATFGRVGTDAGISVNVYAKVG
ncbi:N-acetylmuramoyl-L-alanine amidase [Bradyrhizobium sp. 2S1]|uniref:N-acetylmuramoyl-L-alanine amidase n=1 Tax=Bradyrhizobium sp. 2S1 TaxID=1404429 RepID=UPI00140DA63F|nr:N-acetylmuramoyl-L-alanine amidase [Bradyrhizobium sp. 2S1]MCK7672212.1 N-acetylmuramoyl-L-alanine amidase [Bradyrhizobium sp. 2S1]